MRLFLVTRKEGQVPCIDEEKRLLQVAGKPIHGMTTLEPDATVTLAMDVNGRCDICCQGERCHKTRKVSTVLHTALHLLDGRYHRLIPRPILRSRQS